MSYKFGKLAFAMAGSHNKTVESAKETDQLFCIVEKPCGLAMDQLRHEILVVDESDSLSRYLCPGN